MTRALVGVAAGFLIASLIYVAILHDCGLI